MAGAEIDCKCYGTMAPVPAETESVIPPFGDWPRPARITVWVVLAVVVAMIAGLVGGVVVVRRSLPQTSGTITVQGLNEPVEVRRDANGIPHLYADTSADLFFAQGFVQAQDRFFEMDFKRHVTAGRLSELMGEAALESDQFVRALDWRGVAEREWSMLSTETRDNLDAFSDGVNAYLEGRGNSELSLEYVVLGLSGLDYKPEEWTGIDSLAWLKAMAWDLRGNMQNEIDRVRLSVRLQPDQIAQLYPPYPYAENLPILPSAAAVGAANARTTGSDGIGSNSWVVSGELTSTGKPLLANDPHLGVTQPGVWYQMGLHCRTISASCPYDVSGFTLAGVPGVVIGHNQSIAWGFTNLNPDVSDLYLEKVAGKTYLHGDQWRPLEERDEVIRIRGKESKTITVRSTGHGPLLSDVSRELSSVGANAPVPPDSPERGNGYAVALAWTGLIPSATADALFGLNKATNWEEFREAAKDFAVPSQNLVYADVEGNIGYQAPGRIPVRKPGHAGDVAVPGWDRDYDWTGRFVPFAKLPTSYNPPEGFIVTANQAVTGPQRRPQLGNDWDRGYRSQRIRDLLAPDGVPGRVDLDDMTTIQADNRNPMAATLLPHLRELNSLRPYLRKAERLLDDWDGSQDADSAAAAYFNAIWKNLLELTFADEIGDRVSISGGQRWMGVVEQLLENPRSKWWDDVDTLDQIEDRDQILRQAMVQARDELTRRLALDPTRWEWGRLHELTLENQTLGQSGIGVVEWLFNRGEWRIGGGSAAVDATGWEADEGYEVTTAPSMRMVVDLADLDRSVWINLSGASGHAFSSHYTDQTDLWARGDYLPWASSPEQVEARTEDLLTLEPQD